MNDNTTPNSDSLRPNVLLVVLDTARAKTVETLLANQQLPTLNAISKEGTHFTKAMTPAPWTLPSHASLFTGQYPSDHKTHAGSQRFDPEVVPLASRLRQENYRTAAISGNAWISPEFNFDTGFDDFTMAWDLFWDSPDLSTLGNKDNSISQFKEATRRVSLSQLPKAVLSGLYSKFFTGKYDDGAQRTTSRAINWIENTHNKDPFFMFINYLEPHLEYHPPDKFKNEFIDIDREQVKEINQDPWAYLTGDSQLSDNEFDILRDLYRAELAYVDTQLKRLYTALEEISILDETVLIVVGDHGENIGDHGLMDHQYCLYDTLLHVPLLIRYPRHFKSKQKVDQLVESRDIFSTILDLAGAELPEGPNSPNSLLPNTDGKIQTRDFTISEYLTPQPSLNSLRDKYDVTVELTKYDKALRAIRTQQWKYIESPTGHEELYCINDDPAEERNLISENDHQRNSLSRQLKELRGVFHRFGRGESEGVEANKERLKDLGYI